VAVDNALNTGAGVNSTNIPDANTAEAARGLRAIRVPEPRQQSGSLRQDSSQSQQAPRYIPNEFERYVQDLGARLKSPLAPSSQSAASAQS
jgi:hypothetical protein